MATKQTAPVFTEGDLEWLRVDAPVVKHDKSTGRSIECGYGWNRGPYLSVEGRGVPGKVVIECDCGNKYVNMLARVLLDAKYDANLIGSES
jgi:hypothetical protein